MKKEKSYPNKRLLYLFILQVELILLVLSVETVAQVWQPLGPDDTNWPYQGGVNYLSAAVSNNGVPYIAYMDRGSGDKTTCMNFREGRWMFTGSPGFSEGPAAFTSITVSRNGIPYLVYQDAQYERRATVKKFIDGTWITVGQPGFTESDALNTSIKVDEYGSPYVVYVDGYGPMAGGITVKKFTSGEWINVGQRQFSAGLAESPSLAFDKDGVPYVVYLDRTDNFKVVVKKYSGIDWTNIGNTNLYGSVAPGLAINQNGVPFIAFYDEAAGKVLVKKYRAGTWINVGDPAFLPLGKGPVHLSLNSKDIPYLTYLDKYAKKYNGVNWVTVGQPGEAGALIGFDNLDIPYVFSGTVRKLINGVWKDLGTRNGFSAGSADDLVAVSDRNGIPYVAYQDHANNGKITVMKYVNDSWISAGANGFSADTASCISMAIKNNGVPFVVYKDHEYQGRATVQKFTDYSWRTVGLPGFSDGAVNYTSIAMNDQSTPFVVYRDDSRAGKATVQKFTNGSWKNVGLPGFTSAGVNYTTIRMECGTVPWVIYRDETTGNVELRKFRSGNWMEMPSPGRSTGESDLVINEWGTPYVFYRETGISRTLTAKYLQDGFWTTIGPPIESAVNYEYFNLRLLLNAGSDPYVLYVKSGPMNPESFVTREIKLKYFNGSDWVDIWPSGLGGINVWTASFAFKPAGSLFVAYRHSAERGVFAKTAEMPYVNPEAGARYSIRNADNIGTTGPTTFRIQVYPNPVVSNASVYLSLDHPTTVALRMTDMNGQLVWAKEVFPGKGLTVVDLPAGGLSKGVYLLSARTKEGQVASVRVIN